MRFRISLISALLAMTWIGLLGPMIPRGIRWFTTPHLERGSASPLIITIAVVAVTCPVWIGFGLALAWDGYQHRRNRRLTRE